MSKVTFRARAIDVSKELPIYFQNELPDSNDISTVNRAVPNLPTGMEKEEESEHHLQQAIMSQLTQSSADRPIIPTPESFHSTVDRSWCAKVKIPQNYISVHNDPFSDLNNDYDADTDDEAWVESYNKTISEPIDLNVFEIFMSILDKKLPITNKFTDVKIVDSHKIAVQKYLKKKLEKLNGDSLIPTVRTEKISVNSSVEDPYVAFRRRIEKMQTRKNRKNDEQSYENILILRRSFLRTKAIYSMLLERELIKKKLIELTLSIFDERVKINDHNNAQFDKLVEMNFVSCPNIYSDSNKINNSLKSRHKINELPNKKMIDINFTAYDDKIFRPHLIVMNKDPRLGENFNENFIFNRKPNALYYKPSNNFINQKNSFYSHFEYSLANFSRTNNFHLCHPYSNKKRSIFCRPRFGRGGRIIIDRIARNEPEFSNPFDVSTELELKFCEIDHFYKIANEFGDCSKEYEFNSLDSLNIESKHNVEFEDESMEHYDNKSIYNIEENFEISKKCDLIISNEKINLINGYHTFDDFKDVSYAYDQSLNLVYNKKRSLIDDSNEWSTEISTVDTSINLASDMLATKRAKLTSSFGL